MRERKDWKTIVEFRKCKFWAGPDNKIESVLLRNNGLYDLENFTIIEKLVNVGDICFDIGANIGVYSMVFSELSGNSLNVHAFEPVPHIRKRLMLNAKLNGFYDIHVNNFALGAKQETLDMFQVKEGIFRGGTSSFLKNENYETLSAEAFEAKTVEVKPLDLYVSENKLEQIDFLKIDVEGFEWNVLRGALNTLSKFKPSILMEYDFSRHNGPHKPEEYKNFLSDLSYRSYEFIYSETRGVFILPYNFDHTPIGRNILCL
jgi:FkbM family methyltransferase